MNSNLKVLTILSFLSMVSGCSSEIPPHQFLPGERVQLKIGGVKCVQLKIGGVKNVYFSN